MAQTELNNDKQLGLARMVSINKPSFWLFICSCFVLYIFNKITTPDTGNLTVHKLTNALIIAAAFVALLFNLITGVTKNAQIVRFLNLVCYVFEFGSVVLLAWFIVMS